MTRTKRTSDHCTGAAVLPAGRRLRGKRRKRSSPSRWSCCRRGRGAPPARRRAVRRAEPARADRARRAVRAAARQLPRAGREEVGRRLARERRPARGARSSSSARCTASACAAGHAGPALDRSSRATRSSRPRGRRSPRSPASPTTWHWRCVRARSASWRRFPERPRWASRCRTRPGRSCAWARSWRRRRSRTTSRR